MKTIHLAEIRSSWQAWLAVSLTFIVTNFALVVAALFIYSAAASRSRHLIPDEEVTALVAIGLVNMVACGLTAAAVVGTSTSLVIDSRRGSIARLALGGATPGQIVATLMSQLVAVSLATAVVGDVLAVLALPRALDMEAQERGIDTIPTHYSIPVILAGNLICVAIAVVGGYRQARGATRIPPVEALRQAVTESRARRGIVRWIGVAICVGYLVVSISTVKSSASSGNEAARSLVLQGGALILLVAGVAFALAAPLSINGLTRLWTSVIRIPGGSWHLSRNCVVARGDRLRKSVTPVMFAVGLMFGMTAIGDTLNATLAAAGSDVQLEHSSLRSLITLLGLPLAVSISGSVGSLVMMSKQRDAELALDGLIGATPSQQVQIPILEGVVITVTASVLGLVMAGLSLLYLRLGLPALGMPVRMSLPIAVLLQVGAVCGLVTVAAVTVPTLPSLRQPPPKVIARLIAE